MRITRKMRRRVSALALAIASMIDLAAFAAAALDKQPGGTPPTPTYNGELLVTRQPACAGEGGAGIGVLHVQAAVATVGEGIREVRDLTLWLSAPDAQAAGSSASATTAVMATRPNQGHEVSYAPPAHAELPLQPTDAGGAATPRARMGGTWKLQAGQRLWVEVHTRRATEQGGCITGSVFYPVAI